MRCVRPIRCVNLGETDDGIGGRGIIDNTCERRQVRLPDRSIHVRRQPAGTVGVMTSQASWRKNLTVVESRRPDGSLTVNCYAIIGIEKADEFIPGVTRLVVTNFAICVRHGAAGGYMRTVANKLGHDCGPDALSRCVTTCARSPRRGKVIIVIMAYSAINFGAYTAVI